MPNSSWKLRIVVSVIAVALLVGCVNGDSEDGSGASYSTSATVDRTPLGTSESSTAGAVTVAQLQTIIESTPAAIARDINGLGLARPPVTPEGVVDVAVTLCKSGFVSAVTTAWFLSNGVARSYLLLGPADRLLTLAGGRCGRPASPSEASAYRTGVYQYLVPSGTSITGQARPTTVDTEPACKFLGQKAVGDAATSILESVLEAVSRDRIKGGEILAFLVEVAGSSCDLWLQPAIAAFQRFLNMG